MTASRKECRNGGDCAPRTFEEALDCLAHHSVNTLMTIAKMVNRGYNYLAKACSQYDDGQMLRADLIVPMTLASSDDPKTRNYAVLDRMEKDVDRVAFVLPVFSEATTMADYVAQAHAVKEFADLLQRSAVAGSDGHYAPEEVEALRDDAYQAIQAIWTFVAVVNAKAQAHQAQQAIGPRAIAR